MVINLLALIKMPLFLRKISALARKHDCYDAYTITSYQ